MKIEKNEQGNVVIKKNDDTIEHIIATEAFISYHPREEDAVLISRSAGNQNTSESIVLFASQIEEIDGVAFTGDRKAFLTELAKVFSKGGGDGEGSQTTIVDDLLSIEPEEALSANQGRILKGFIDDINNIINSDDTSLDTLQEVVAYIQTNRATLDALGIDGITGLATALEGKVDKEVGKGLFSGNYGDLEGKPVIPESTQVVDNLTSTSTTDALSANQGKVLEDGKVDKEAGKGLFSGNYNDLVGAPVIPESTQVVDTLTSTSTTDALSANQGKVLEDGKMDKGVTRITDWNDATETGFYEGNSATN